MKIIGIFLVFVMLSGCGSCRHEMSKYSGYEKTCIDGVTYLQFPSGAAVQVNADGTPVTCQ